MLAAQPRSRRSFLLGALVLVHRVATSYAFDFAFSPSRKVPSSTRTRRDGRSPLAVSSHVRPLALALDDDDDGSTATTKEIIALEREVLESARSKLDAQRVRDALLTDANERDTKGEGADVGSNDGWKIPAAAASVAAFVSYAFLFHSIAASALAFVAVYLSALGDPLEEEGVTGAVARVVGRTTLRSIRDSEPKVRSVLRASIQGDEELFALRTRVSELEKDNERLRTWIDQRNAVDNASPRYSVDDLRRMARDNKVDGTSTLTKSRLMMRLLQEGVLDLDDETSLSL